MPFETIKYEVADQILTITLNRPDKLNAFNPTMQHELIEAFDKADADDNIRAIIVTGEGRNFCSGADVGGMERKELRGEREKVLYEGEDGSTAKGIFAAALSALGRDRDAAAVRG